VIWLCNPRSGSRLFGAILLAHFLFVCAVKVLHGTTWHLLWFCHISLAIAALGFLTQSKLLKATALTNVFVLHSLWIFDFTYGYATGNFPLAFTADARDVDLWNWLASLHHLYVLPLLLWSFWREREYPREAWLISATVFVVVMLASRSLLWPAQNVNYSYFIPESLHLYGMSTLNQLPDELYLLGVHGIVNLIAFFPATIVLTALSRLLRSADNATFTVAPPASV